MALLLFAAERCSSFYILYKYQLRIFGLNQTKDIYGKRLQRVTKIWCFWGHACAIHGPNFCHWCGLAIFSSFGVIASQFLCDFLCLCVCVCVFAIFLLLTKVGVFYFFVFFSACPLWGGGGGGGGLIATYVASCLSLVGDVANVLEGEWW